MLEVSERGFTLIEMVVVVMIISILASISMPQYFRLVERARVVESFAMLGSVRSAQERYLAKEGTYATSNAQTGRFDVNFQGNDPTYGMRYYFMVLGPGDPAGCPEGSPFYNVAFVRVTGNAGVASRYFPNYMMVYERCADRIDFPGCPECAQDFVD